MYDARGEWARGSHREDTGNQWRCKRRGELDTAVDQRRKPELPDKAQWLVVKGWRADVGKHKLCVCMLLNGSNIDQQVDKCMDPWPSLYSSTYLSQLLFFFFFFFCIAVQTNSSSCIFHHSRIDVFVSQSFLSKPIFYSLKRWEKFPVPGRKG